MMHSQSSPVHRSMNILFSCFLSSSFFFLFHLSFVMTTACPLLRAAFCLSNGVDTYMHAERSTYATRWMENLCEVISMHVRLRKAGGGCGYWRRPLNFPL